MKRSMLLCAVFLALAGATALHAESDDWNLPATQRVTEGEAAAVRGDIPAAERILKQLESEAKTTGALNERTTAEARVDRLRLAVGRAQIKAQAWDKALLLLKGIQLEGKSLAVQRAVCAATLDALKPVLFEPSGHVVAPWTPVANDKFGPLQPNEALRAPYTKVDRAETTQVLAAHLTDWERLAGETSGTLTVSEQATVAALNPAMRALVRYAWGLVPLDAASKAVDAAPETERRALQLQFAQLLLREHDLARAVPRLIDLERGAKDETSKSAADELLRIHCAYERLHTSLPMWNPGLEAAVKPYLTDATWANRREKIVSELDKAIGAVDLKMILGESLLAAKTYDAPPTDPSSENKDVVVPPEILAKAELGDHFETVTPALGAKPATPDDLKSQESGAAKEKADSESPEETAERGKLNAELQKRSGERPSRYRKLGFLGGVLRKNILLTLSPHAAGSRETREEYELQIDHQEFMIEALGPVSQKDTSQGFRPLTPDSPLRLLVLSRYHGELQLEARRLPTRLDYEKLDATVTPDSVAALPVVKTFDLSLSTLADNLHADPSKRILEVKDHGLAPGFYVLTARARYSPVIAMTRLAVSETKVVVRHAPKEVLIWTLDRITGSPRSSTLKGEISPEYTGAQAWGAAPLPNAGRLVRLGAIDASKARELFLAGLGDELNHRANANGEDDYLAGVAEGRKLHEKFPEQALPLPAHSDANGIARIAIPENWRGHKCRVRVVADGCEVDAIESLKEIAPEKVERVAEWVADRPVVRPGQIVRLHAFVRENRNGRMVAVHGGELPLKLMISSEVMFDASVPIDENGGCDFEQIVDAEATDGLIRATSTATKPVCVVMGGELASRRVRLELPQHPSPAGSRVKARALVESAAGVPLAGVPLHLSARFKKLAVNAAAPLPFGDDFAHAARFGTTPLPAWDNDRDLVSDSNGEAQFEIEVPEETHSTGSIRVQAPGGRRAEAACDGYVLGMTGGCVWHSEPLVEPPLGKPAHLVIQARTLTGEPYTRPFLVADSKGHTLATFIPGADGSGSADVQTTAALLPRMRPADSADGDWQSLVSGTPSELAEVRGEHGVLAARLDAREYRIGDVAHLHIRADRPGVTVLMTTENAGVTRASVVTLPARATVLDIAIAEQDSPNSTVALTTLADDRVECVLLPLDVSPSERKLDVALSSDTLAAEPGKTVHLTAQVKDARGQPVAGADVVIAAFDRQLLTLADDPAPEFGLPFVSSARVAHDVGWTTGFNTFSYGSGFLWLAPEWSFGPYGSDSDSLMAANGWGSGAGFGSFGTRNGGGRKLMFKRHGGSRATESTHVRGRFSEQALWLTHLKTGADGRVTAPFEVPDSLTTFRTVAYALDERGYPGSARFDLPVLRDVEMTLDLPPELREGDHTAVLLSVWNHGAKPQTVKVTNQFALPVLSSNWLSDTGAQKIPETLAIAPHSSASLRYVFDVTAPADAIAFNRDDASLRFEVSASDVNGTLLDHAVFHAPLRYMGRPEHEITQAVIREKGAVHVPFAGSYDPNRTSLTLTLRRGLTGLALDIRELQYVFPEHCPEQTLSRFVPAMVLANVLPQQLQAPEDHAKLERVLKSGIARMRSLGSGLPHELLPLSAWYLRRLSQLPAGREALKTNADWINAAGSAATHIRLASGETAQLEEYALPAEGPRISAGYGAFREDLWMAFGAAQTIHDTRTALEKREQQARFSLLCRSAVALARAKKLEPQDRALAALLCAQVNRRDDAEELLRLRAHDAEKSAAGNSRAQLFVSARTQTLAQALDLLALVELKKPDAEIFDLAFRLEAETRANGAAFGTTFLNGIGLMALADALKLDGIAKAEAGPITVKLAGAAVAELPVGVNIRRVTLDRNSVEKAFRDGWDFTVETPAGQHAGIAVERRTLQLEKLDVKSPAAIDAALDAFAAPNADPETCAIQRCLFVRPPADAATQLHQNWRPYAGQTVPAGTELLVLTKLRRAAGSEFLQWEVPTVSGWESMVWNEEFGGSNVEYQRAIPGLVDAHEFSGREDSDTHAVSTQMLAAVREHRWANTVGSVNVLTDMTRQFFSDRGSRLVQVLNKSEKSETVVAQSGVLHAPGRYQLPGARVWGWYDPTIDVTSAAELIQVGAPGEGSVDAPGAELPSQKWVESAWTFLAREGWSKPAHFELGASEAVQSLALLALGHNTGDGARALVEQWCNERPKISTFPEFQKMRAQRLETIRRADLETMRPDLRALLLAPYVSYEGLRGDWVALGLGAQRPPDLNALTDGWLQELQVGAKESLPLLKPELRASALALHRVTVREILGLWFGADQEAGLNWLWRQPMRHFSSTENMSLDAWVKILRETYGLNVTVDPFAPVIISLPVPRETETLKEYFADRLAEGEIVASGLDDGKTVTLARIGEPAAGKVLDAKSAMNLPLFSLSAVSGNVSSQLRTVLSLRGVQLVTPDAEVFPSETVGDVITMMAAQLKRGIRVEHDIIELK